jgi:hypothetical protein
MFTLTQILPPLFRPTRQSTANPAGDMPDNEGLIKDHEIARDDLPCCGGYNEAFVIQYWAGYTPRN